MWEIVVALLGFIVALVTVMTPVMKLNGTIAKLNTTVELLNQKLSDSEEANKAEHKDFCTRIEHLEKENAKLKTKVGIYHGN